MEDNLKELKVGEFFVEKKIITNKQLNDALEMQKDNRDMRLGQILVTQGVLSKGDLIMALEMFLVVTDSTVDIIDEWLEQDEIDMLIEKFKEEKQ